MVWGRKPKKQILTWRKGIKGTRSPCSGEGQAKKASKKRGKNGGLWVGGNNERGKGVDGRRSWVSGEVGERFDSNDKALMGLARQGARKGKKNRENGAGNDIPKSPLLQNQEKGRSC